METNPAEALHSHRLRPNTRKAPPGRDVRDTEEDWEEGEKQDL